MSVFSLCLVRVLCSWMSPLMQVMFLVHGLSGLGLLRLPFADAFRFSGGPVSTGDLVLGRGSALFRVARLGGPLVKRARSNAADVILCQDSSVAPLLDMRRRFKAVMDVLGAMVQYGVSLLHCRWNSLHSGT